MNSAEICERLAGELRLDLIGPSHRNDPALRAEILPDPPSRWYLTDFSCRSVLRRGRRRRTRKRKWTPPRRVAPMTTKRRSGVPRAPASCRHQWD
jgi:hypothetical protein